MIDNWPLYLLVVAAVASGWWLGRRQPRKPSQSAGLDHYAGLNYLLNEEPERAVARFIQDLKVNPDTLDTHLALGNLLRRRGDVEKAVVVHENILKYPVFEQDVIHQVQLELARDYLLAGLLDRAEKLLLELCQLRGAVRVDSLVLIIELYEREKDWQKAIMAGERLAVGDETEKYERAISHYYCELAMSHKAGKNIEAARLALRDGIGHDAKNPRTSLVLAELEIQEQRFPEAFKVLQRIKDQDPAYVPESLPLLRLVSERGGASVAQVQAYLEQCLLLVPSISIVLALAQRIREVSGDEAMSKFIANHLKRNPTIRGLTQLIDLHMDNTQGVAKQNLSILRSFAEALVANKPVYRCHECGFEGKKLHWHCPICKRWGSIHAIFGLEGE